MSEHTQTYREWKTSPDVLNTTDTADRFREKKRLYTEFWHGLCSLVLLDKTICIWRTPYAETFLSPSLTGLSRVHCLKVNMTIAHHRLLDMLYRLCYRGISGSVVLSCVRYKRRKMTIFYMQHILPQKRFLNIFILNTHSHKESWQSEEKGCGWEPNGGRSREKYRNI